MLKRYMFYGVSLELIAVMGIFLAVLLVILFAAQREAFRTVKSSDSPAKGKKGRVVWSTGVEKGNGLN